MLRYDVVDGIKRWIEAHDAAWIIKEDRAVYLDSLADGKGYDKRWIKYTPTELMRIVVFTGYTFAQPRYMEIATAFQELDRVYEYGIDSKAETRPGVFNYFRRAGMPLLEVIVSLACEEVDSLQNMVMIADIHTLVKEAAAMYDLKVKHSDVSNLCAQKMQKLGYRRGDRTNRILIAGKKQMAYVHKIRADRSKDVIRLDRSDRSTILMNISRYIEI